MGHDFGGACISYAMEMFPSKVSKAIFVAAAMLSSGQSVLDIFSQQVCHELTLIIIIHAAFLLLNVKLVTMTDEK